MYSNILPMLYQKKQNSFRIMVEYILELLDD